MPAAKGQATWPARCVRPSQAAWRGRRALAAVAALCAASCAPALDWRDVRPAGTPLALLMPCRPQSQSRTVQLGGQSLRMQMLSCEAQGQTWAVAWADVQDPRRIAEGLNGLAKALQANVAAATGVDSDFRPPGATPNAHSRRSSFSGSAPDGRKLWAETAVFNHATVLFQVTVIAPQPVQSAQVLFDSLKLGT